MAGLSLRQAADAAGTSKSTILRAIQAGRLSAARTDDGGYDIQPAELFRVYPPKPEGGAPERGPGHSAAHGAPLHEDASATELRIRNAGLEAELRALKELVEAEKRRNEDLKAERDRWAAQAERLAISAPIVTPPPPAASTGGWWPFRRRA